MDAGNATLDAMGKGLFGELAIIFGWKLKVLGW
jgi:hypothetical protein